MRIAVVTGVDKPTTLQSHGGTEVWTANFAVEIAKKGHRIDLYAAAGSVENENIRLISVTDKPLTSYYDHPYFKDHPLETARRKEQLLASVYTKTLLTILEKQSSYDLLVDSIAYPSFSENCGFFRIPVLSIGHFPVDFSENFYRTFFSVSENRYYAYPSRYQYDQASFIPASHKRVIPHGIAMDGVTFSEAGGAHLIWLSRIHTRTNKGPAEALKAAIASHHNIKMLASIEPSSVRFFEEEVKPLTADPHVEYITITAGQTIDRFTEFANAKAFLFPIQWEEPFGLVMVESMATGTPIIATARGSVPEIVRDGVTGFIVNPSDDDIRGNYIVKKTGMDGLVEAVERMYSLSGEEYTRMRRECRKQAETRFNVKRMADEYETLFSSLISG
jgi:glycosyltransferase involved in cell wall biosynthesis